MLIHEFIVEYCQDIVETYTATHSKLLDSFDLPYDDEIEDDSGELMKVVYCGEKAIPINDILSMSKSDLQEFTQTLSAEICTINILSHSLC